MPRRSARIQQQIQQQMTPSQWFVYQAQQTQQLQQTQQRVRRRQVSHAARRRRNSSQAQRNCLNRITSRVMHKFKQGALNSSRGAYRIRNRGQAIAIAMRISEKQCLP